VASQRNGTLYTGSTDDILRRAWEHREKRLGGFTAKYDVSMLVWYEEHASRGDAFRRERRIKDWRRVWKLQLIEAENPDWRDLYFDLVGPALPGDAPVTSDVRPMGAGSASGS
jgi:putative endonuclease